MNQTRHTNSPLATSVPVVLMLLLALIGCSDKSDTPTSPPGTWTVTGKTAFIGAVNPLPGITVRCGGQSTTSGSDGSYELRGVPEGAQVISAEGPNCRPYSKSIEVAADTRHFIYLEFNGTTISGYVSNLLDGPIQGAIVKIGALFDETDQGGHYQIADVPLKSDSIIVTHTRYYSTQSLISPAGPDTHLDLALQRDTVVAGRITADQYVDERQAKTVCWNSRLIVGCDGYIGSIYYGNIRRHIYINFDFPAFMKDARVAMLDGNLELCTDAPYGMLYCDAYAIASQWFYFSLTFDQQPTLGMPLGAIPAATVAGSQYVKVLTATAMQQLLENYRKDGLMYGVTIQASSAGSVISRSFYSMRSPILQPRVSFKVRF